MQWSMGSDKKSEEQIQALLGVYETDLSIAAVYGLRVGSAFSIQAQFFQTVQSGDSGIKQVALQKFIQDTHLSGVPCVYVAGSNQYSLHLVETPAVAIDERSKAVSWLIRDFINFPIEEAVIDTFELPFPRAKDNMNMLYAVVAKKEWVHTVEQFIKQTGLELYFIDIPELALNNLINLNTQYAEGGAFVRLTDKTCQLMLCQENQICMMRSFDVALDNLESESGQKSLESLCVEIQRSFDYVSSMFRKNIQNKIVLMPNEIPLGPIQESIKNIFGFESQIFGFDIPFKTERAFSEIEKSGCMMPLGSVLRLMP